MDIIIPLGGKGKRFADEGYPAPKPLIQIGHKEMIRHVVDRLEIGKDDTLTILYYEQLDKHNFSGFIRRHYPGIHLAPIPFQTRGAVETIDYGLRSKNFIENNERKCLLLDCDAFYTCDVIGMARNYKNGVFVFREEEDLSQPAKFSYVSLDDSHQITDIAEKSRISQFANTGAYLFENKTTLLTYTKKVLDHNFRFCNEFYTSCVIKYMLMDNYIFHAIELPTESSYISLGTPRQVSGFLSHCHTFLFDLDGTLVDTTNAYIDIWKKLLEPYNANVDYSFFKNYIDGNNDDLAVKMLIPTLSKEEIDILSRRKDELFLGSIDKLQIVKGAVQFIADVRKQGHPVGIVTNCNRSVAENIVRYCGIENMIDAIVIGNECDRPKPHPDPYQKAKDLFNNDKVIILEDSCVGLLSARSISPKFLVCVNTHGCDKDIMRKYGADLVINNFNEITLTQIMENHVEDQTIGLEKKITESILGRFPDLVGVKVLPNKLKGGYIADVVRVDLVMKNGGMIECVAKLQNDTENDLSLMATRLGLYAREQYFYEAIRDSIRIKAPRYFGTIRENMRPCGILLEYLPPPDFQLGIDLEKESLDLTLVLVRKIASHHARFWGKDLLKSFPQLTKNNSPQFCPSWSQYVKERWPKFKERWKSILTKDQLEMGEKVAGNFDKIQTHLSNDPLTLCHGDVKSPNIFFRQGEPYFIDWQYIIAGKGVQDMVFLMIESFSIPHISKVGNALKDYYYIALLEEGVVDYKREEYEKDFQMSICYFPFFVAMWFGTTPPNQLIDVNFPFFFVQKLFSFMNQYLTL